MAGGRPIDGHIRPAVAVVVRRHGHISARTPRVPEPADEAAGRGEDEPRATGGSIDGDIGLEVAIEIDARSFMRGLQHREGLSGYGHRASSSASGIGQHGVSDRSVSGAAASRRHHDPGRAAGSAPGTSTVIGKDWQLTGRPGIRDPQEARCADRVRARRGFESADIARGPERTRGAPLIGGDLAAERVAAAARGAAIDGVTAGQQCVRGRRAAIVLERTESKVRDEPDRSRDSAIVDRPDEVVSFGQEAAAAIVDPRVRPAHGKELPVGFIISSQNRVLEGKQVRASRHSATLAGHKLVHARCPVVGDGAVEHASGPHDHDAAAVVALVAADRHVVNRGQTSSGADAPATVTVPVGVQSGFVVCDGAVVDLHRLAGRRNPAPERAGAIAVDRGSFDRRCAGGLVDSSAAARLVTGDDAVGDEHGAAAKIQAPALPGAAVPDRDAGDCYRDRVNMKRTGVGDRPVRVDCRDQCAGADNGHVGVDVEIAGGLVVGSRGGDVEQDHPAGDAGEIHRRPWQSVRLHDGRAERADPGASDGFTHAVTGVDVGAVPWRVDEEGGGVRGTGRQPAHRKDDQTGPEFSRTVRGILRSCPQRVRTTRRI